jgi:hypothetical protein
MAGARYINCDFFFRAHANIFSACLNQLDLMHRAIKSSGDAGTVMHILETSGNVAQLRNNIGPIPINVDTWVADDASQLQRVGKDAEIDALVLLAYWTKDDASLIAEMTALCNDLVFAGAPYGTGSALYSRLLGFMIDDEKKRDAIGTNC